MSISTRLRDLRKSMEPPLTQFDLGIKLGLSRDTIANLENGRVEPSESILKLICMTFDVNWLWLKDGEGEMKNPPDTVDEMVDRIMTGEESFKKSVFRAFARLGDDEWQALQTLYDSIKKECHCEAPVPAKTIEEEAAEEAEAYRQEFIQAKMRQTSSASDTGSERIG